MEKLKSFWNNSTVLTKIIIGAIFVAGVYFGVNALKSKGVLNTGPAGSSSVKIERNDDADLVIAYNTFPGMEGILYMNGGMEPSENSKIFQKYGIKLQIKQMDVVADTREALKSGLLDAVYCTTDVLPIEMSSGSTLLDIKAKQRLKINESRGADAIVATKNITRVSDLKGKKVAYAVGTASNTLLINVLETSGLTMKDINTYKVSDGVEAASAFKNGQVDAAVVWAPDDEDCVKAISGAKVLISTKTATQIIADGLLITDAKYNEKKDLFVKLAKAWLEGNGILNVDASARKEANALFAKGFNFPEDVAAASADKIRFSTLADNKQFFGYDATYTGVTGEKMYGKMSVKYTEQELAKSPAPWRNVSDGSLIEELLKDNTLANNSMQTAAEAPKFAAPTKADEQVQAQSSKVVSLTFPTAGYILDDDAQTLIDREVSSLAQAFAGARIRVEGNTDNVGNPAANKALSFKRAQAVVNYLIREYKFDKNKFIIVGNGPDKPVADNSTEEGKQANRRTDFQFIW